MANHTKTTQAGEKPICASTTPLGRSAIAAIRVSGPGSVGLVRLLFRGVKKSDEVKYRYAYFGKIVSPPPERIIDEVICIFYQASSSYTGEEGAEIFCHGNPLIVRQILEALIQVGFEAAQPGEFTKRAFLNGKIDLTQAEAVHDLVEARSERELQMAQLNKGGSFRRKILSYRSDLLNLAADITAELDFSDDDITLPGRHETLERLRAIQDDMRELLEMARRSEIYRKGLEIVIAGAPNSGKSSLLNEIIGRDRALVSSTPGTTRDYLEAGATIAGIPVKYVDTAGIRSKGAGDTEKAGMELALRKWREADIRLYVIDISLPPQDALEEVPEILSSAVEDGTQEGTQDGIHDEPQNNSNRKIYIVLNKHDIAHSDWKTLLDEGRTGEAFQRLSSLLSQCFFRDKGSFFTVTSLKNHQGVGELLTTIGEMAQSLNPHNEGTLLSVWQNELMSQIVAGLDDSYIMAERGESTELIAASIHDNLDLFGSIVGEITNEEILGRVFSRFCIGK